MPAQVLFRSASIEWGTPPDLYRALDREFGFTLDAADPASPWDGRARPWDGERVYCNPPYGRGLDRWLAKGPEAVVAVFLLPARTDTKWFHHLVLPLASEVRFIEGRLRFTGTRIEPRQGWLGNAAPFPSMIVVYRLLDAPDYAHPITEQEAR